MEKDQGFLVPKKSVFNKITGDSHLELRFASFLEECDDVLSFAKNYFAVHFSLDYVRADGNISAYYPDFFVRTTDGKVYVVETKGLEDLDVRLKMERLKLWCQDTNLSLKKTKYDFVFVDEESFDKYKVDSFFTLVGSFRAYKE